MPGQRGEGGVRRSGADAGADVAEEDDEDGSVAMYHGQN